LIEAADKVGVLLYGYLKGDLKIITQQAKLILVELEVV
jgi:hypothetical protein